MREGARFASIREASMRPEIGMPEWSLRNLVRRNLVPGVYSGTKFLVDTKRFLELLDTGALDFEGR